MKAKLLLFLALGFYSTALLGQDMLSMCVQQVCPPKEFRKERGMGVCMDPRAMSYCLRLMAGSRFIPAV